MSIREVIEMLKFIFETFMEYFGDLFAPKDEGTEEGGDAEAEA